LSDHRNESQALAADGPPTAPRRLDWDEVMAAVLAKDQTPPGRRALPLRQDPQVRHLPHVRRSLSEIDPDLRAHVRRVVAGEAPWPLVIHGPVGTGKTCAALVLLDHVAPAPPYYQNRPTSYQTASELAERVIEAQQGRLEVWVPDLWKMIRDDALVVLDELGARSRVSDHHYDCVKRLIDERLGRPLVVVSNLALDQVAEVYDDRIASRLAAGTVVLLKGDDRRLRK
jgi:hypothetical protein